LVGIVLGYLVFRGTKKLSEIVPFEFTVVGRK
jgi:hypothetical protein